MTSVNVASNINHKTKLMKLLKIFLLAVVAASCAVLVSCGSNATPEPTYIEPVK